MLKNIINANKNKFIEKSTIEVLPISRTKKQYKHKAHLKVATYPIIKYINPEFNTSNNVVIFCIYYINLKDSQYISYLLNKVNDTYYLPQIKIKSNITAEIDNYLQVLNLSECVFRGHISENNRSYFFYELENIDILDIYNDDKAYLFGCMYEILLTKKILNYYIDSSVFMFFDSHNYLQTLYYEDDTIVPMSCVSYYVSDINSPYFNMHLNNIIIITTRNNNKYGPFIITSNYESAMDYRSKVKNKNDLVLFRKNVFIDKVKILILSLNESYSDKKSKWKDKFDTLYVYSSSNDNVRLLPGTSSIVMNLNIFNLINI